MIHPQQSTTTESLGEVATLAAIAGHGTGSGADEHPLVAITDGKGRITFVNDRCCEVSKYRREELLGRHHRILEPTPSPTRSFLEHWAVIQPRGAWRGELKNRAKDGSVYLLAATIVPVVGPDGNPREFIAVGVEIPQPPRSRAALSEQLRLLRLLLAELSSRFVGLPSGEVDAAIEEALRLIVETLELDRSTLWQIPEHGLGLLLTHCWQRPGWPPLPAGFPADSKLPWACATVLRGEMFCFNRIGDLPPEAADDAEQFRTHGSKSNVTIPLATNGRTFGALAFATLGDERVWQEEEIIHLKLVSQIIGNVLARQRAELREDQVLSELARAMRIATLGELAAELAHELNQPLAAILSNAQAARRFLASGAIDAVELRTILDDIVRDDKRAGEVLHCLRRMTGKHSPEREACRINDIVREVAQLMHAELLAHRLEARYDLAPELPFVLASHVELQQVLLNLLVNAIQAMEATAPETRFIDIRTQGSLGGVEITIRDRGHGLLTEGSVDIFDAFVSTKSDGLGMGLSICRRIIGGLSGRIEVHNHPEGGAMFSIWLPASEGPDGPGA